METKAPLFPAMERLEAADTVVFRQLTQYAEAVLPVMQQNKYVVATVPDGVKARTRQGERGWSPSGADLRGLGSFLLGYEMSALWERCLLLLCGGANLRAMSFNIVSAEQAAELNETGWRNVNMNADVLGSSCATEDGMRLERPCLLGGACCMPFRISVLSGAGGAELGYVRENFEPYGEKCAACACQCLHYHDVFDAKGGDAPAYQLVVGRACYGPHNNCFGATCCKESMIFDVLDPKGERVATIEKIFAREEEGCLGGVCRALHDFSNYVVTFPPGATLREKQLILGALTQVEYLYFVPKGGDN